MVDNDEKFKSKVAKARWKILAQALRKDRRSNENLSEFSVRNFKGFDLYEVTSLPLFNKEKWLQYRLKRIDKAINILVRVLEENFSPDELLGFNNTGNVCVWPSEEVLGYYCCKNKNIFRNKKVLELGCGMSALAGLQIALQTDIGEMMLTDGNEKGIENVEIMLGANKSNLKDKAISCRVLKWENSYNLCEWSKNYYDVIIAADCLFFEKLHTTLITTFQYFLNEKGKCIVMAPKRSGSLNRFVQMAERYFDVEVTECYDELIWEKHLMHLNDQAYNQDLHLPILVILTHKVFLTNA